MAIKHDREQEYRSRLKHALLCNDATAGVLILCLYRVTRELCGPDEMYGIEFIRDGDAFQTKNVTAKVSKKDDHGITICYRWKNVPETKDGILIQAYEFPNAKYEKLESVISKHPEKAEAHSVQNLSGIMTSLILPYLV